MRRWIRPGLVGMAAGAVLFEGARRRHRVAPFFTHVFNPLVLRYGLAGGRQSPWAIVEHVGRRTGVRHRTPIGVLPGTDPDHVFVRLTYGADVQWVRNVLAAGACRIQRHGELLDLDQPEVVTVSDEVALPGPVRLALDSVGHTYLRLRVRARRSGPLGSRAGSWHEDPPAAPAPR